MLNVNSFYWFNVKLIVSFKDLAVNINNIGNTNKVFYPKYRYIRLSICALFTINVFCESSSHDFLRLSLLFEPGRRHPFYPLEYLGKIFLIMESYLKGDFVYFQPVLL